MASLLAIVFTDVVESSATKRDVSLGRDSRERDRAYLEKVQARHFSLVRECSKCHQGREVSTMGDAFYLVFDDPVEAVRCSIDIQKRLAAEPIETPRGPLRLRIGIHSGYPEFFEGSYHGTDVDKAARVEAMATAQQILLSAATYELVRHMSDVKFRRMGEFALKGMERGVLWEADWDGKGPRKTAAPPLAVQQGKRRRNVVLAALAAVLILAAVFGYRYRLHGKPVLTDRDTIVLADFINKTGDPIFEDTLKQALAVALRQSPFLSVLSDNQVASVLRLMERPAGTAVTGEVAREVCQRAGSRACIAGSIAALGSQYVLGLKALGCASGETLAEEQATAAGKENVLNAVGQEAAKLREELGESLASVQKFDTPLEQATTSSLAALKAYSMAVRAEDEQGSAAALPFFQRAIELDPSFAAAYAALGAMDYNLGQTARAREYLTKAFALRERTSEREKLDIAALYYNWVTGELAKADQTYQEWIENYPKDDNAYADLSVVRTIEGDYTASVELLRQVIRLRPNSVLAYVNRGGGLMALGRLDEARRIYQEALSRKLDDEGLHMNLYSLAFLAGDTPGMASQAAWFEGKPDLEHEILATEADTEAYRGHLASARGLTGRAAESAVRADNPEAAAEWRLEAALWETAFGNSARALREGEAALKLAPESRDIEVQSALLDAWSGDESGARKLEKTLQKAFPLDTLVNSYWLPTIDARMNLVGKNPAGALEQLQAVSSPMELGQPTPFGVCLYPVYTRGEAYLAGGQGSAAASEFQKILDHRGIVVNCPTGALAHLGLARAYALQVGLPVASAAGTKSPRSAPAEEFRAKARAAYQDFLTLWKDADSDIPILKQARAEYARLK